ncbi:hypothetical protein B0H14DRAFT_528020 [Mycena olivaceomarginata]|nr:hypothetical protein B0H14DRAFT_528020 [Mycena olivaceomarginata]
MHIWRRRVGAFPACVRLRLACDLYLARVVVWGMNWVPRICTARLDVYAAHILLSRWARKCEARVDVSAVLRRSFLLAWSGEHRGCASAIVQAILFRRRDGGVRGIRGMDVCTIVLHLVLYASRFSSLFEPGVNERGVCDGAGMCATFVVSMPFCSLECTGERCLTGWG